MLRTLQFLRPSVILKTCLMGLSDILSRGWHLGINISGLISSYPHLLEMDFQSWGKVGGASRHLGRAVTNAHHHFVSSILFNSLSHTKMRHWQYLHFVIYKEPSEKMRKWEETYSKSSHLAGGKTKVQALVGLSENLNSFCHYLCLEY